MASARVQRTLWRAFVPDPVVDLTFFQLAQPSLLRLQTAFRSGNNREFHPSHHIAWREAELSADSCLFRCLTDDFWRFLFAQQAFLGSTQVLFCVAWAWYRWVFRHNSLFFTTRAHVIISGSEYTQSITEQFCLIMTFCRKMITVLQYCEILQ